MSGHYSSVMMFSALVAIAMAANWAEDDTSAPLRRPSAIASLPEKPPLSEGSASLFRHTDKLRGSLEGTLEMVGEKPSHPGDVFVMRASVTSDSNLQGVSYKWSLPADVEVVNGPISGIFDHVDSTEPVSVELTLKSNTGENHQVHFMVGAARGTRRFADSVQYNTLMQDDLVAGRKLLLQSTKATAAGSGSGQFKVMH